MRANAGWVATLVTVAAAAAGGCSTRAGAPMLARQQCVNPDARLSALLHQLDAARSAGCDAAGRVCDAVPLDIERQAVICPTHTPTILAAAVLAYEQHQPARAEQWLDTVLSLTPADADAAALRARLALEAGNLPLAMKVLERGVEQSPAHGGLQEVLGAAYYLSGRLSAAQMALVRAERFGAPHWRVAYGMGLVAEAEGQASEARRLFQEALAGRPGWPEAEARLKALGPAQAR